MKKYYSFTPVITVTADSKMNNDSVKLMWNGFTHRSGSIDFVAGNDFTFTYGDPSISLLPDNKEYVLHVDEKGIFIIGKDYGGLMRGFMSLLMKIKHEGDLLKVEAIHEESNYLLKNRMFHLCVFPDNDLLFIKKIVRLAAACQYTHIVIEFWGMLKYDCMKELAWPQAFSKDQAFEVIKEAKELGLEPIPMSNQLGHATSARGCYGRHVVLDQNPRYHYLFTPDGWAWNIYSDKVKVLLRTIRKELYDLFGDGEYMHLGCDEAYIISHDPDLRKGLLDYLASLTSEVEAEGRRPMIWMDMLLEKNRFEGCYCAGEKDEVEFIRNSTAKATVFVDWQYGAYETPVPSLFSLKDSGHDVIGAPWSNDRNYKAVINTVNQNSMFGIMYTTWHTIKSDIKSILGCAKELGAVTFDWSKFSRPDMETATLLRCICSDFSDYEDFGWAKHEIDF